MLSYPIYRTPLENLKSNPLDAIMGQKGLEKSVLIKHLQVSTKNPERKASNEYV